MREIAAVGGVTNESEQARIAIRSHRAGDLGWILFRHGELYSREFGWDERFESLVARVVAEFLDRHDPICERCWVAELDGDRAGSVMLVRDTETTAKLRLLLVVPNARGMGIGGKLIDECLNFARGAGYREVRLWTNSRLHAARTLYLRAGFELVDESPHPAFSDGSLGQTWKIRLTSA